MRTILFLLLGTMALGACNTMEGVGRDIKGAGAAVEDGAQKVKKEVGY